MTVPDPLQVALGHIAEARMSKTGDCRHLLLKFAVWAIDDAREAALEEAPSKEQLIAIENVAAELQRVQ